MEEFEEGFQFETVQEPAQILEREGSSIANAQSGQDAPLPRKELMFKSILRAMKRFYAGTILNSDFAY